MSCFARWSAALGFIPWLWISMNGNNWVLALFIIDLTYDYEVILSYGAWSYIQYTCSRNSKSGSILNLTYECSLVRRFPIKTCPLDLGLCSLLTLGQAGTLKWNDPCQIQKKSSSCYGTPVPIATFLWKTKPHSSKERGAWWGQIMATIKSWAVYKFWQIHFPKRLILQCNYSKCH